MNVPNRTIAAVCMSTIGLLSACTYTESDTTAPPSGSLIEAAEAVIDAEEQDESVTDESESVDAEVEGAVEQKATASESVVTERYEIVNVPRGLNLREGPGTEYDVIGGIEKDRILTGTDVREGSWTQVQIDGLTGWVASTHLEVTGEIDAPPEAIANVDAAADSRDVRASEELVVVGVPVGLNLRTGPGLEYKIVGGAPLGSTVFATGATTDDWIEVDFDGVVGWGSSIHLARG